MSTEHVSIQLPEYAAGTLDESIRSRVEQHLASCVSCRDELQTIADALRDLGAAPAGEIPDGYFTTILPHVRGRLARGRRFTPLVPEWMFRLGLPLAAAALTLIFLGRTTLTNDGTISTNPLLEYSESLSADDWVDGWSEQLFSSLGIRQDLAESEVYEHLASLHAVQSAAAGTGRAMADELSDQTYQSLLSGLTEQEFDELLERLSERKSL